MNHCEQFAKAFWHILRQVLGHRKAVCV
jgi:hypothetical protein